MTGKKEIKASVYTEIRYSLIFQIYLWEFNYSYSREEWQLDKDI